MEIGHNKPVPPYLFLIVGIFILALVAWIFYSSAKDNVKTTDNIRNEIENVDPFAKIKLTPEQVEAKKADIQQYISEIERVKLGAEATAQKKAEIEALKKGM